MHTPLLRLSLKSRININNFHFYFLHKREIITGKRVTPLQEARIICMNKFT